MNKVNPNEAPEGYIAVYQGNNLCNGCDFYSSYYGCSQLEGIISCIGSQRNDKKTVVFIKKQIRTEDVLESIAKECNVQGHLTRDIEFFASKVFEAGVKFGKEQANKELN